MTPVEMQVLLHHFYRLDPFPEKSRSFDNARGFLRHHKLIRPRDEGDPNTYETTDKGDAMVAALEAVPLPVPATGWVVPKPKGEEE